jgi:hypothetical protein
MGNFYFDFERVRKVAAVRGGIGKLDILISLNLVRYNLKGLASNGKVISRLNKDATRRQRRHARLVH